MNSKIYDVIIIGGGAAGLTAGIYCGRSGLDTLIIEEDVIGGLASKSYHIGNYPGFPKGISGLDLMDGFYEQACVAHAQFKYESVCSLNLNEKIKVIETNNQAYKAHAVIIATGGKPKKIGAVDEERFIGKGVSFCSLCDGPETKGQVVLVIGTGDSAIDQSICLAQFANFVFISSINPEGELDCSDRGKISELPLGKVKFLWNTEVCAFRGKDHLSEVTLKDRKSNNPFTLACDYCFECIGFMPNSQISKGQIEINAEGEILTNERMETSCLGVYAIGDVRKKGLKQLTTATADGAIAASEVKKVIGQLRS